MDDLREEMHRLADQAAQAAAQQPKHDASPVIKQSAKAPGGAWQSTAPVRVSREASQDRDLKSGAPTQKSGTSDWKVVAQKEPGNSFRSSKEFSSGKNLNTAPIQ